MILETLLVLLVVAISYVLFKELTWKALPWPKEALTPPPFQGHRGFWKEGKRENTIDSFRAARERGLKMFELDVRLSKDQIPVVFHDDDLSRIVERKEVVAELKAEELKMFTGAPTLEEVLSDPQLGIFVNIELKTDKAFDGTLEQKTAEVIHRTKSEKRILFSSFNPLALYRMSKLLPNVPRALLATGEDHERNKIYLRRLWLAPFAKIHLLHLDQQYVTKEEVREWTKRGVPVAMWTVNDPKKAEEYLGAGAVSIISDTLH